MEKVRKPYESLKQISTALSYPGRSDQWEYYCMFDDEAAKKSNTKTRKIYDPTAIRAFEIWSNGLMGYYMPKEIRWFMGLMADRKMRDLKRVRKWLQETDEHLSYTLNQSNYYEQKKVAIMDAAAPGDSYMYIDEDNGKQIINVPHPREFWTLRDFWGRIIAIHHKFSDTLKNIKDEFGEQALTDAQKLNIANSPETKIEVIHAVYKNKDYVPGKLGVKNMVWQHYYVNTSNEKGERGKIIRETGSDTLNPVPWSLNRPSHEPYGRGIVSQMLVEILTANFISKDMLSASQLSVKQPLLITSALKHKLDMGAGGVTFVGNREMQGLKMGDLVARLFDTSGYPFGAEHQQKWQAMIDERFGVPLFLALNLDTSAKTLGEVRMRQAEKAVMMSPFLSSLSVTTDMELDRIYSIELQAGRAPEAPPEVLEAQNKRIDIDYIGPIFQLLKQYYETGNLLTTIMNIREVLSVSPQSAIVVDGDELMRKILKSSNAPEDIILSENDVAEIKAIAAQQQEAQMAAEIASKSAGMIPDLSKKIEKDSLLSAIKKEAA